MAVVELRGCGWLRLGVGTPVAVVEMRGCGWLARSSCGFI